MNPLHFPFKKGNEPLGRQKTMLKRNPSSPFLKEDERRIGSGWGMKKDKTKTPDNQTYGTSRKPEPMIQFEEELRRWSPFIYARYGEINGFRIIRQAREEFEQLLAETKASGASHNHPKGAAEQSAGRMALIRVMEKQGETREEAEKIIAQAGTSSSGGGKKAQKGIKRPISGKIEGNKMKAINVFAQHLVKTRFEDLPHAAVAAAKQEILDSLATALGGSTSAGVKELVDIAKEWGGAPQSTIIGYGLKVPAPSAAQVNGTMIHALDYDDGHQVALVHIGCVAVSTAFAAAERMVSLGKKVSGKELITALALGADFDARMSLASKPGGSVIDSGWHATTLFGFLTAAAIAGRIFSLDEDKMINAIGLAYHQAGGAGSGVADGALAKRMGPGFAARVGIISAQMAERGITGDRDPLEGKTGLYRQYMGGDYESERLTRDLGKIFEGVNIGDKPYPCCGLTHAAIDGVLALQAKHKINPAKIKEVLIAGAQSTYDLSQPPEIKRQPRTIIDAQFSVPYVVAVALLYGRVTVNDFTLAAIKRPEVLKMAQKITTVQDKSFNRHGVGPSSVKIIMADGKTYKEHIEYCRGSVERPMSLEEIARKFRECAPSAVKPLKKTAIEKVIKLVERLEELDDATEIIKLVG